MIKSLTNLIPLSLKIKVSKLHDILKIYVPNKKLIKETNSENIYLMDTPTHSNLGDHAIAYAERIFCEDKFPTKKIIEIPIPVFYEHIKLMKKYIKKEDIICMVGGGNFGDLYEESEIKKRMVCSYFPDNKIIIFPQTIYYTNTQRGNRVKKDTAKILNEHKNLTIATRDEESYRQALKIFDKNNVILVPDIVMYLKFNSDISQRRNGILCCFRNDIEKSSSDNVEKIYRYLEKSKLQYKITDTIADNGVSIENRLKYLKNKWNEFMDSDLVITDRLHGLIFSFITQTPCIAIDNNNHKIKNYYNTWLKDKENYIFLDEGDMINSLNIEKMINYKGNKGNEFNFSKLIEAFNNDSLGE